MYEVCFDKKKKKEEKVISAENDRKGQKNIHKKNAGAVE